MSIATAPENRRLVSKLADEFKHFKIRNNGSLVTWMPFKVKLEDGSYAGKKTSGHIWTPYHEDSKCPQCGDLGKHSKEATDAE